MKVLLGNNQWNLETDMQSVFHRVGLPLKEKTYSQIVLFEPQLPLNS